MVNLDEFINRALAEDIGEGDHTSLACIPVNSEGKAHLLVKQEGVLAGVELAEKIFNKVDNTLEFAASIKDGAQIHEGDIVFIISGSSQSILKAERLVLNCMQRMSGIATLTNQIVESIGDLNTAILDTRKTTPGFRTIEKWAVRIGGGKNHRFGLYDMIMIKDNHIDFCGGIPHAIDTVNKYLKERSKDLPIAIEARNIEDVNMILTSGNVHRIMLDNFTPDVMKEAIDLIDHRFETEATGGITIETVREYAQTGVDFISIGALTHSANSLDLSLKAVE